MKLRTYGGNVVIASVYPLPTSPVTLFHGDGEKFITTYTIPAVPKGEYRTLTIWDAHELQADWSKMPDGSGVARVPVPVMADGPHGIGADVLRQWTTSMLNMGDGVGPGIRIVAVNHPNPETYVPTEEQLGEMKTVQARWFEVLFYEAGQIAADKNRKRSEITPLHREAAKWLGLKSDWEDTFTTGDEIIDCPACTSKIKSHAAICPVCRTQLRALSPKLASLPGNLDLQGGAMDAQRPGPLHPPISNPGRKSEVRT